MIIYFHDHKTISFVVKNNKDLADFKRYCCSSLVAPCNIIMAHEIVALECQNLMYLKRSSF